MVQWAHICLSAVLHPVTILPAVSLIRCCQNYWSRRGLFLVDRIYSDNGGSRILWKVGTLLPNYTASHIRNGIRYCNFQEKRNFLFQYLHSFAFYIHSHCCIQIIIFKTSTIRPYLELLQSLPRPHTQFLEGAFYHHLLCAQYCFMEGSQASLICSSSKSNR